MSSLAAINIVDPVQLVVGWALFAVVLLTEGFALVHSIAQRAEAYTAAGKLTKPSWVGINLAAILVTVVLGLPTVSILGLIAIIASWSIWWTYGQRCARSAKAARPPGNRLLSPQGHLRSA
ncbi:DUF2516 family protein [Fodinicola feengrottensis]|uniref:DUF2516 family protein n=1 Tax=Fodinicola feengrottensis TaxID=435914 RepID=UPI002441EF5B|nr:DUF2516 family protein [Fodinicola feengrottensis]